MVGDLDRIETALIAMQAEANMHGYTGVAVALIAELPPQMAMLSKSIVIGNMDRPPDVKVRGEGDMGTNYFSVVFMKIGEMLRTRNDSGTGRSVLRFGEPGFKGGRIILIDDFAYVTAFSGVKDFQDLQVADAGMLFLIQGLKATG